MQLIAMAMIGLEWKFDLCVLNEKNSLSTNFTRTFSSCECICTNPFCKRHIRCQWRQCGGDCNKNRAKIKQSYGTCDHHQCKNDPTKWVIAINRYLKRTNWNKFNKWFWRRHTITRIKPGLYHYFNQWRTLGWANCWGIGFK